MAWLWSSSDADMLNACRVATYSMSDKNLDAVKLMTDGPFFPTIIHVHKVDMTESEKAFEVG